MEEMIRIVTVTVISIASLAGIIKWGIEKYFKKSEEVTKLREKINQQSIKTIEATMDRVASEIITLGRNMSELEQNLVIFNSRLQDYEQQNSEVIKSYLNLSNDIKRKLRIFENLELYELKDNVFVFKRKNH